MNYIFVAFLWIAFGVVHSYLISVGFVKYITRLLGVNYAFYRLVYNLFACFSFFGLMAYTGQVDKVFLITVNPYLQFILLGFSAIILLVSLFTFDALEFLGIRQILDYNKKSIVKQQVTMKGLYGIVRHPMYLATLVFMWSLNSTLADIIMKVILTGYIFIGSILEERKLIREFGESYKEYQKKVPMLIPFTK